VQCAISHLGIEILVAPYEADAQLTLLARNGHVAAVISEYSDLLVYGCPEVLFKYNSVLGKCDRIFERDLASCMSLPSDADADFLKHVAVLRNLRRHSHSELMCLLASVYFLMLSSTLTLLICVL
jgi:5'-3' exonuclease